MLNRKIHEYKKLELLGDPSGGSSGGSEGLSGGSGTDSFGSPGRDPGDDNLGGGRSGRGRGGLESSKSKSKSRNSRGGLESSKGTANQIADAARSLADALDADGGNSERQNKLTPKTAVEAAPEERRAKKTDVVEAKKRRAGKRVLGVPGDIGVRLNTLF